MIQVNIDGAKTQLSRLLEQVEAGEEIVICRDAKPVARLVPLDESKKPRPLGIDAGRFHVPDDFNAPLPEDVFAAFEGQN